MRRISSALLLALAALALAVPASAERVQTDVDGDGAVDTVSAQAVGDYGVGVSGSAGE